MYNCEDCVLLFNNNMSYEKRIYIHRNQKEISFKCVRSNCGKQFSNYRSFNSHRFRFHLYKKKKMLKCSVCEIIFDSKNKIVRHMAVHFSTAEQIVCPISNCTRTFNVKSRFGESKPKMFMEILKSKETEEIKSLKFICKCFNEDAAFIFKKFIVSFIS